MKKNRVRFALIISSIITALTVVLVPALISFSWPYNQVDFKLMFIAAFVVTFISLILLAQPSLKLVSKYQTLTIPVIVLSGGIVGVLVFQVFLFFVALFFGTLEYAEFESISLIWGSGLGMVSALTYALISGVTNQG